MPTLSSFPHCEIQLTRDGQVHDTNEVTALLETIKQQGITDLFVISHGWNNDLAAARALYTDFFASLRAVLDSGSPPDMSDRRFGILAVLWPAKKFAEPGTISSGAAGIDDDSVDRAIIAELDKLAEALETRDALAKLGKIKRLIGSLDDDPRAQRTFADTIRGL